MDEQEILDHHNWINDILDEQDAYKEQKYQMQCLKIMMIY